METSQLEIADLKNSLKLARGRLTEIKAENARLIQCNEELISFVKEMANRYSNSEWIGGEAKKIIEKLSK